MQFLLIGIVVIIAAAGAWFFESSKSSPTAQAPTPIVETTVPTTPAPTPTTPSTDTPAPPATTYKDGTYSSSGSYKSPGGIENIDLSVTLAKDVVTSATFKGHAVNPMSVKNQGKFTAGYSAMVVGKPIDSINLTVVNGSSLTSGGFMDALNKIKSQARI